MIRPLIIEDVQEIAGLYNYYIENSVITFEEEIVSGEAFAMRLNNRNKKLPFFVYELEGRVVGYAYASEWKSRCAYRNSAEVSIYLSHLVSGKGIGTALYTRLISQLKQMGYHTLIGGIALPNEASVRLHEKLGFEKVAHFKQVGYKFEKWIDVAYWQLML